MPALVLSGDIGGTKTLLQLASLGDLRLISRKEYPSQHYSSLEDIVIAFLSENNVSQNAVTKACFAVAGPVSWGKAKLTNLSWEIDSQSFQVKFHIPVVRVINDFEAVGFGIEALKSEDLHTLQCGQPQQQGVRVVLGAGTGLGVAQLSWEKDHYHVYPSEGGHADFAPTDDPQIGLLQYLKKIHSHVSYERVVSGLGLVEIFRFLCTVSAEKVTQEILAALDQGDHAAVIAQFASEAKDQVAVSALNLFIDVYGAFAGNLALITLARGGVYIAGGIAPKILPAFRTGRFMKAFADKGRFAPLLNTIPVHVVTNSQVGLLGATVVANRA